jgi:hypothetical protein
MTWDSPAAGDGPGAIPEKREKMIVKTAIFFKTNTSLYPGSIILATTLH